MNHIKSLALMVAGVALIGCSSNDSSTNGKTTPTKDMQFYGAKVALAESDLPKCDSTTEGQLFYVLKTSEFQFCTTEGYEVIDLAGADGADGADGEPGLAGPKGAAGAAGSSCSVKSNTDGTKTISCTDNTTATIKDGEGCSVLENLDGSYDLTCGDVTVVVKNGEDGADGANGQAGEDGLDFLSGVGNPEQSLGKDGDTYLNVMDDIYYKKASGLWTYLYGSYELPKYCDTFGNCGIFTDSREKLQRSYRWIKIGKGTSAQVWMAENLNFYTDESECKQNDPEIATTSLNTTYCETYGRLYHYADALTACPTGWHLPTDAEWQTLELAIGMSSTDVDKWDFRGTTEGNLLKSMSTLWNNAIGTDDFGFGALPAGFSEAGIVDYIGDFAVFWTSTADVGNTTEAVLRSFGPKDGAIERNPYSKDYGLSVRCVLTTTP